MGGVESTTRFSSVEMTFFSLLLLPLVRLRFIKSSTAALLKVCKPVFPLLIASQFYLVSFQMLENRMMHWQLETKDI